MNEYKISHNKSPSNLEEHYVSYSKSQQYDGINMYSFALQPGDLKPSGSVNYTYLFMDRLFTYVDNLDVDIPNIPECITDNNDTDIDITGIIIYI